MKTLLTLSLACISTLVSAQNFTKTIQPFSKLRVSRGVEVTLVKSETTALEFNINGLLKSDIIVEQNDGTLELKVRTKGLWELMEGNTDWWVKVEVPYQVIKEINVSSGASVSSENELAAPSLKLVNKMGGNLSLTINTGDLRFDTSMGAESSLKGKAKELTLDASMGAVVDAFQLHTRYATVESSMGSSVKLSCEYEFDGSASMGGEIRLKDKPEKMFERESMGGYISIY